MTVEMDGNGYHGALALNPELKGPAELWLAELAEALGFEGAQMRKDGAEVRTTRWHDDGRVEVEVYLLNEDGRRYAVGEGAQRRAATEWVDCPIKPPAGLEEAARTG